MDLNHRHLEITINGRTTKVDVSPSSHPAAYSPLGLGLSQKAVPPLSLSAIASGSASCPRLMS